MSGSTMAASLLAPTTSQLSSPLGSQVALLPGSYRTPEVYKKRSEPHRKRNLYSDHGHSAKRESSCRSSTFEGVEPGKSSTSSTYHTTVMVPSGSVDSTIRRTVPSPGAHHHSANEHTHSVNDYDSLQQTLSSAAAQRYSSSQQGIQCGGWMEMEPLFGGV